MTRRRNVQHGRRRRLPASVLAPLVVIVMAIALLCWEGIAIVRAVMW